MTADELIDELREKYGLPDDWRPVPEFTEEEKYFWSDEASRARSNELMMMNGMRQCDDGTWIRQNEGAEWMR